MARNTYDNASITAETFDGFDDGSGVVAPLGTVAYINGSSVTSAVALANGLPVQPATSSTWVVSDGGGSLTVDGTVAVSGSVAVTGTFWQATQPVSIAGTVAVSGPLTDAQLRASAVPVSLTSTTITGTVAATQSGTWTVTGAGGTFPVTDSGGSLTVDAPVAAPVFVRLSDGTDPIATLPVSGTFWQATQPVSVAGTVAVSGPLTDAQLRATPVPVSGTVAFSNTTIAVTNAGTFAVQAAQAGTWNITNVSGTVSLPTGAATAAKQPALGTAGSASADVLTVQGAALMTPLTVDGSGVTQPVSGTFWQATQPVSGTVTANAGSGTFAVSAAALPLPSGAATETTLASVDGKTPALGQALAAASVPVVLTAAQLTTLTPPAAITGFATETTLAALNAKVTAVDTGAVTISAALPAGNNNVGDVDVASIAAGTNYVGRVRLTDGTTDTTVLDLTNANPLTVAIVDGSGDQIASFGGGTQYTEDAAAAANPVGTALNLVRDDARGGSLTTTNGNNVAARGTNAGELYVKHVDSIPVTNAGTFATQATQAGTWTVTGAGGTFPVTDSGGSLTVDAPVGTPVFVRLSDGSAAISTLPVSLASVPSHAVTNAGTFAVQVSSALPAGANNIGDVDVLTVPADPFGANADAASATGSISAKLRFIASTGIPITGTVTVGSHAVTNAGTFAVQAAQSGTWNVGTVTTLTTCSTVTSLTQMNGQAIAMGTGTRSAGTQRVTIATDDVVPASQSGTWSTRTQDGSGNAITSATTTPGASDRGLTVRAAGTTVVSDLGAATATLSNVSASASSVQLLASTAGRRGATVYNDSTVALYLKFGTTASATSFTVLILGGGYYEFPAPVYTGRVDGIWASATGSARITETTT